MRVLARAASLPPRAGVHEPSKDVLETMKKTAFVSTADMHTLSTLSMSCSEKYEGLPPGRGHTDQKEIQERLQDIERRRSVSSIEVLLFYTLRLDMVCICQGSRLLATYECGASCQLHGDPYI